MNEGRTLPSSFDVMAHVRQMFMTAHLEWITYPLFSRNI